MPLRRTPPSAKRKERNKIRHDNVEEVLQSYDSKGSIGTSHPKNKRAAIKQAVAISYSQERRSKKRRKKGS